MCVCCIDNLMHHFFVCSKVQWSHILRDLSADSLGHLDSVIAEPKLGGPATSVGHVSEVVAPAS